MLLNICKIKKLLNSFNKCRSFIGIFLRKKFIILLFCCSLIWTWPGEIVFMLCKFETPQFTTFQVSTEHATGFKVLGKSGVNYVVSRSGFRLEPSQFIFESSKKIVGSFIEIISPNNVSAEEVSSKATEQGSKCACDECYDVWWHLVIPSLLGSLSTISGWNVCLLFYHNNKYTVCISRYYKFFLILKDSSSVIQ